MQEEKNNFFVNRPSDNFTIVPNGFLNDKNLSFRAKGVLSFIYSRSKDFKILKCSLHHFGKEGRDALVTAFDELVEKGYIRVSQKKNNGQFNGYQYSIDYTGTNEDFGSERPLPIPEKQLPLPENTGVVDSRAETDALHNTRRLKTRKQKEYIMSSCEKLDDVTLLQELQELRKFKREVEEGKGSSKGKEYTTILVEKWKEVTGKKKTRVTADKIRCISGRIREGHSLEDMKNVLAFKYGNWKDDPVMSKHIVFTTIFGTKFNKYIEEYEDTCSLPIFIPRSEWSDRELGYVRKKLFDAKQVLTDEERRKIDLFPNYARDFDKKHFTLTSDERNHLRQTDNL